MSLLSLHRENPRPIARTTASPAPPRPGLRRWRPAAALLAVPALLLSAAVSSAQEAAAPATSPSTEQVLPETVITATRTETPLSQIGSSVTIISREQLENQQIRQISDVLQQVPGVDIRRQGGAGKTVSIFMRGTDSDHTLLLVDGMPIHDVSSPTGAAALDFLTTDNVERIEVLRGPQSSVYGSRAIGGVINILTRKGVGAPQFSFSAEGGSFATSIERFSVSGGSDLFNYSLAASRTDTAGFSTSAADGEKDPYRNTTLATRFGFQPTEIFGSDFFFRYVHANTEFDSGGNFDISETDADEVMFRAAPHLSLLDGKWVQTLSVWIHNIQRDSAGAGFFFPSTFEGQDFGMDWHNELTVFERHRISFGVDFENQDSQFQASPMPEQQANSNNIGVYGQDQIELLKDLYFTAGFRVDNHDEFGTEFTWRTALAYTLDATDTTFRGSYGTGFKAPSLAELYDTSFGSNNPNLEPETSTGFDFGFEQPLFSEKLAFSATYFQNDVENLITGVPPAFANENVEDVRSRGVELSLAARPCKAITARTFYTYTDTEALAAASFGLTDGSRLLRRPLHNFGADITYSFLEDRASATLTVLYVGEREDIDPTTFTTVTNDSYVVVNLAAAFKITKNVEIFGRVDNLFDEEYQDVLGFNSPGVSGFGGVRVTF